MDFHPHIFGRYVIIDPVAEGGMAAVFRARLSAQGGPDRLLIIKMIRDSFASDPDFVEMFEAEIKVTLGFTHPNIIQVYDYGRIDGKMYSAMEYVQGPNLDQIVKKLQEQGGRLDLPQICFIVGQICQALAYAHNYQNPMTGETTCIVHRDISPHNILISYNGAVKLFDFGIAKATNAGNRTSVGVIKGKPSYLSPEQAKAAPVDGRSDLFAIGVVLWELLTGKRLFATDDDMETIHRVIHAPIPPPSSVLPLPPQLDQIVLKALERKPEARYQNAEDLQRDLLKVLSAIQPTFQSSDLGKMLRELFAADIAADREQLRIYLDIPPIDPATGKPVASTQDATRTLTQTLTNTVTQFTLTGAITHNKAPPPPPGQGAPKRAPTPTGIEVEHSTAAIPTISPVPSAAHAPVYKSAGTKTIAIMRKVNSLEKEIDTAEPNHTNFFDRTAIVSALLVIGGLAYWSFFWKSSVDRDIKTINANSDRAMAQMDLDFNASAKPSAASAMSAASTMATVQLDHQGGLFDVYLNGAKIPHVDGKFQVPVGQKLKILVKRPGYEDITLQEELAHAATFHFPLKFIPELPKGFLNFEASPSTRLIFYLNGEKIYETVGSIEGKKLPVGKYRVVVENKVADLKSEESLVIEEWKTTNFKKKINF